MPGFANLFAGRGGTPSPLAGEGWGEGVIDKAVRAERSGGSCREVEA